MMMSRAVCLSAGPAVALGLDWRVFSVSRRCCEDSGVQTAAGGF